MKSCNSLDMEGFKLLEDEGLWEFSFAIGFQSEFLDVHKGDLGTRGE